MTTQGSGVPPFRLSPVSGASSPASSSSSSRAQNLWQQAKQQFSPPSSSAAAAAASTRRSVPSLSPSSLSLGQSATSKQQQQQNLRSPLFTPMPSPSLGNAFHNIVLAATQQQKNQQQQKLLQRQQHNTKVLILRYSIVLVVMCIVFITRNTISTSFVNALDFLLSSSSSGSLMGFVYYSFFFSSPSSSSTSSSSSTTSLLSSSAPLGCTTNTFTDNVVLLTILFHHELTILLIILVAILCDTLVSLFIRYFLEGKKSSSSSSNKSKNNSNNSNNNNNNNTNNSPSSSNSNSSPASTGSNNNQGVSSSNSDDGDDDDFLLDPNTENNNNDGRILFTPRSITCQAMSFLPSNFQARVIVIVVLLLLFGVDLENANVRFMSLSISKKLSTSTRHPQWTQQLEHEKRMKLSREYAAAAAAEKKKNNNNNNEKPATDHESSSSSDSFDSSSSDSDFSSSSSSPIVEDIFLGVSPTLVAKNSHLECELKHALRYPSVTVVSGPRSVGKSVSLRHVIKSRSGFYCDMHRASTPEMFESTVEKCIEEHTLLNERNGLVPRAWHSLFSVVRSVLSYYLWNVRLFDSLASAFSVATLYKRTSYYYDSSASKAQLSDHSFLAKRCFSCSAAASSSSHDTCSQITQVLETHLFVLDGVRDSSDNLALGLLDQAPNVLGLMQRIAPQSTIVLVAASDFVLSDLSQIPHLQFTSSMQSRIAFVTAAPAEIEDVAVLYENFGEKILRSACKPDVQCAMELFSGAFSHTKSFANLILGAPQVAARGELHSLCNSALRNVVASAFSVADATSGWQQVSTTGLGGVAFHSYGSLHAGSKSFQGGGKHSAFSSSSPQKDLSFRLRALSLMLDLSSRGALKACDADVDVTAKLIQNQIVFEETVQFPMCLLASSSSSASSSFSSSSRRLHHHTTSSSSSSSSSSVLRETASFGGGALIRPVAPILFNVTLYQILVKKSQLIDESLDILEEDCELRRARLVKLNHHHQQREEEQQQQEGCRKWVRNFIQSMRKRVQEHKNWMEESDSAKNLKYLCGKSLIP